MTRKNSIIFHKAAGSFLFLVACAAVCQAADGNLPIDNQLQIDRPVKIYPDYSDTVIPPNIAPLNFLVQENAARYSVRITPPNGSPIQIASNSPTITLPASSWHALLDANRGQTLRFDISIQAKDGRWTQFQPFVIHVAAEDIDGYLVYRKIHPAHVMWSQMGIYQRSLRDFQESLILDNSYSQDGCLNCHTFCNNRTDKMLLGIRSSIYGNSALLVEDGQVHKIGTTFGYTSWHPSGRLAAYSINKVIQFFHSNREEVRDVLDMDSLVAYYLVDAQIAKTAPQLAKKDRLETYPTWSPDGRYLYFCSAPVSWKDQTVIPERYDQIKYDLLRIPYNLETDQWGELEPVLLAETTGMSILLPRISPDGRRLLFCMCDYGCFPVYQRSSDLYMIDLNAAEQMGRFEPRRLEINSDSSESWHCWSSNSRWIAFSSKRDSGAFTRIYISYVDESGNAHKPFLLPRKDPTFYDSCLWTYSVPELVTEPVRATKESLGRALRSARKIPAQIPVTSASPKAVTPPSSTEPWRTTRE
jgi:hypothetical protein